MILICGIPTEPPITRAIEAAEDLGIDYVVFDQRRHATADLILTIDSRTSVSGRFTTAEATLDIESLTGIYVRLMDDRFLPDLTSLPPEAPQRSRARAFHDLLHSWLDIASSRVANRPCAMLSNMSKTYQASIIAKLGFKIPETLVTNDPAEVLEFVARCESAGDGVIYKSLSGVRSIVQQFRPEDCDRLPRIRWCPTQFQRRIAGVDIRVHVVGPGTFATEIKSAAIDYRYTTHQTGFDAELSAIEIPPSLASACVELATALELPFAGIDLRRTPQGNYVCFEVNPCPAYSYYETRTGAPIARALVAWLAGYVTD